jgi:hypothetical protein
MHLPFLNVDRYHRPLCVTWLEAIYNGKLGYTMKGGIPQRHLDPIELPKHLPFLNVDIQIDSKLAKRTCPRCDTPYICGSEHITYLACVPQ